MLTYNRVEMMVFPRWPVALAVIVILALPICSDAAILEENVLPAATGITLIVDFGNGTEVNTPNLNGSTVLELTENVYTLEVEWYGPYVLVTAIDGVASGNGRYWQYWVNGQYASTACNVYELSDADEIKWVLTSSQNTGPPASLSNDRFFAVTLVAGFGSLVLLLLFIMVRRKD